jgi:hypothetical protein
MPAGALSLAAGAVAAAGVLALAGAGLAASPVLALDGGISAIAADRDRVAVTVRSTRTACDGILVWKPSTGSRTRVDASTNCPGGASLREQIREVALAGRRVAWIEEANGNLQNLTLRVHRLDRQTTVGLSFAENHDGAEGLPDGRYVGYLEADGDRLAYNTWSVCTLVPADYEWDGPSCEARGGDQPTEIVGSERLWVLGPRRALVGAGPASFALATVDADRLATLHRREVSIFGVDGAELGTIVLERGRVQGVGLWGGSVVLVRASRLEAYSIATGRLVKTLPAPPGASLADVDGSLAVLTSRSAVTVVSLTDGASRTFRRSDARVAGADLEPAGLFHAWSLAPGGRVAFVPRAQLVTQRGDRRSPQP